jgi:hypothetical protein
MDFELLPTYDNSMDLPEEGNEQGNGDFEGKR